MWKMRLKGSPLPSTRISRWLATSGVRLVFAALTQPELILVLSRALGEEVVISHDSNQMDGHEGVHGFRDSRWREAARTLDSQVTGGQLSVDPSAEAHSELKGASTLTQALDVSKWLDESLVKAHALTSPQVLSLAKCDEGEALR